MIPKRNDQHRTIHPMPLCLTICSELNPVRSRFQNAALLMDAGEKTGYVKLHVRCGFDSCVVALHDLGLLIVRRIFPIGRKRRTRFGIRLELVFHPVFLHQRSSTKSNTTASALPFRDKLTPSSNRHPTRTSQWVKIALVLLPPLLSTHCLQSATTFDEYQ